MALDRGTKLEFLTNDRLVVYHTRQSGQDSQTPLHIVEAFFIRATDGSVVAVKNWPTRPRRDSSDGRESEGRLIPLAGGRFLVVSNDVMGLYSDDLRLLKDKKLEPDEGTGFWNVQSADEGSRIFLRHEARAQAQVTFSWLNSDTLAVEAQMPPYPWQYEYRGMPMQGSVAAGDGVVFGVTDSGVRMLTKDEQVKTVCGEQICRGAREVRVASPYLVVVTGGAGIGVFDTSRGLQWSKAVSPPDNLGASQFGRLQTSISGTRFAFWIDGSKKTTFDGVRVTGRGSIFVYDASNGRRVYTTALKPRDWDWDFALSPDGGRLAVYDGAKVRIYRIE